MSVATNEVQIQVAKQTAKGAYPANPTYALRWLEGGLSSKPTVDEKNVGDGSIWSTSLQRIGYIETGGTPTLVCDPISLGLLLTASMGTDTPAGGGDPYSHVITPATALSGFPYLTFWQEFDDHWSVFHDCQIVGFELVGSVDDKFLQIKPTIIGMAREQKCAVPGSPATAETDAYHWLDAGGYWCLIGDATNLDHSAVPTAAAGLYAWLGTFKTAWNAHCAVASGRHHKAADAVNVLTYGTPVAALADAYTALDEIETVMKAHIIDTTVHYFADTTDNQPDWATPNSEATALACAEEVIGYVNAPGCYNRHLGATPGIKTFSLSLGMNAKGLQGEGLTAYTIHRGKGTITVGCEKLMEDFRLVELAKFGDPAAAFGTDVTDDIQYASFATKFVTESVGGKERSLTVSVPEFQIDPEPLMSAIGNTEGNEIYLTLGGKASGTDPKATCTLLNGVATY